MLFPKNPFPSTVLLDFITIFARMWTSFQKVKSCDTKRDVFPDQHKRLVT